MRRHPIPGGSLLGTLTALLLCPSLVLAEGFGTPTLDGLLAGDEAIYGAAEASDPADAPQGNAVMDLGTLYVANDNVFWYFLFTINADIDATRWGKYLLCIDTTNDANGGTTDAWGRNIIVQDPHKPEYTLRGWVDALPYGPEDTQFWVWDQGLASWSQSGGAAGAARAFGATSGLEWKIERSRLGDPSTIWVEVLSTGGGDTDNAQDTINDPADDWNATDWITTSIVLCSTEVARSSGVDTTPPTVVSANVENPGDGFSDTVVIGFSEPVDAATALNAANYSMPGRSVFTPAFRDPQTVEVEVNPVFGFGTCESITVTNVQDLAGNPIVNNGTTNVGSFYAFRIHMRGFMSIHMQDHDVPPHTFAVEGSLLPLTWDPLCDFALADADADSVYTGTLNFSLPCSGGTPVPTPLEYKFTHQCTEYETISNHTYTIDPLARAGVVGVDTLDIWWNDEAPSDFTANAIDVIFTVRSFANNPPFGAGDMLGVDGSELPLTWDVPPVNLLADDGVAPDQTAGDGVFSTRLTFPAGSFKNVEYKYLLQAETDSVFAFECEGQGNRGVFLNDEIFSTANPIVLDLAHYDDCAFATGVEDLSVAVGGFRLDPSRPNPTNGISSISYALPHAAPVRLDVYDVRGRLVRTLVDEVRPQGRHTVVWNGRAEDGRVLPSGVYFTRLQAGDLSESRKLVLMR